jgi:ribosomal protein S18 acetylase RimI-like enzyme
MRDREGLPTAHAGGLEHTVALQPASTGDDGFLERVYASTRQDELAPLPWSDEQKAGFLQMQHTAQHQHYHTHFPQADYDLILVDGVPAGRLYVWRAPEEILLIDIALLPEYRNSGIGGNLLRALVAESRATGKPLHLHVEPFNPALRLYQRLGFEKIGEEGIYWLMEWNSKREAGG